MRAGECECVCALVQLWDESEVHDMFGVQHSMFVNGMCNRKCYSLDLPLLHVFGPAPTTLLSLYVHVAPPPPPPPLPHGGWERKGEGLWWVNRGVEEGS